MSLTVQARFGGRRLETQVKLCAGRPSHLLLGFIGPKVEAIEIKAKLARFLQTIKLTLSTEKSLITHANKDRARFLNYEIAIAQDNNQYNPKQNQAQVKRRSINGRPIFRVPRDVIKAWCQQDTRKGKTVHRPGLLACSDYEIIKTYGMQLQGLVNYYQYAHNVSHLYTVKYHLRLSLTKTIAAKHKRPTTWVYKKYKQLSSEGMTAIIVQIPNPNNPDKPLCAQFGNKPIRRQQSRIIIDEITSLYPARTELVTRLLANTCELCGSTEKIRGHHVRQLKDIQRKYRGRPEPPAWAKFRMARHRKTVVVCHQCHTNIHAGKYDGRKVK